MEKKYIMGVDLGGTKISVAISLPSGNLLKNVIVETKAKEGEEAVMGRIIHAIHQVLEESNITIEEVMAIGVGTPGIIDKERGKIIRAVNLPFTDYDLLSPIKAEFQVDAYLENDANAAALGEYLFGAGKGKDPFIYITVSTGVGGGVMVDGRLLEGFSGNGFEIGHTVIDPRSEVKCTCGLYGDVESLCSGTAMARAGQKAVDQGEVTLLSREDPITTEKIHEAYLQGDVVATKILKDAFHYLGMAMGNLVMLYNPETIVIGGGVSSIGDFFFQETRESAQKYCFPSLYKECEIVPSSLSKDSGVIGALAVAQVQALGVK